MPRFSYQAIDSTDGSLTKGFIDADDRDQVQRILATRGVYLLKARKAGKRTLAGIPSLRSKKITRRDAIELATNLSVMIQAGIPIITALSEISRLVTNRHLQNVILEIKQNTESGMRFSDTFLPYGFPDVFVKIVQVGEETGQLESSLKHIAEHLQKMEDLSASIKRALIYPAFAIVATMGALGFWLYFVLPGVMATMKDLGVKLPPLTRALAALSETSKTYWYVLPIMIVLVFIVHRYMKSRPETRYLLDKLKLQLPIIRLVVYNKIHAIFAEQLRILIISGLPIEKSMSIIADVMGNEVYKEAILRARERIAHGSSIAGSLREQELFAQLTVRMIEIGEKSGTLDHQFSFLSEFYIKKLDDISAKMGKIIEPVVITFLGVFFAIIIAGLLLPIYDIVGSAGKR